MRVDRFLGEHQWGAIAAVACQEDTCACDLRDIAFAYPSGIVGLVLCARDRASRGLRTVIALPTSDDVLNYLERVNFLRLLAGAAEFDRDTSFVARNRRIPSTNFTEVLTPSDEGFGHVRDVIEQFLELQVPGQSRRLYDAFNEVLMNIEDHSDPDGGVPAFSCVHAQVYAGGIELAFGDLGVGFLATLRRNPNIPNLSSEIEALEGALLHGYSRFGHEQHRRGGGLRRAASVATALGGEIRAVSRDGGIYVDGKGRRVAYTAGHAFPGTLVRIWLPRSTP